MTPLGFLANEQSIDGFSIEKIETLFSQIERQASLVIKLTTYALRVLLIGNDGTPPDFVSDQQTVVGAIRGSMTNTQSQTQVIENSLTGRQLEVTASRWGFLVPESRAVCAVLAYRIAHKYPLLYSQIPNIRQALQMNELTEIYQQRYGKTLEEAFNSSDNELSAFSVSTVEMLKAMGSELEWVAVRRGETLVKEGEPSDSLYVLVSGRLSILKGEERIAQLSQGAIVGELGFLSDEPRSATVIAMRDSIVMRLTKKSYQVFGKMLPAMQQALIEGIVRRFGKVQPKATPPIIRSIAIVGVNTIPTDMIDRLQEALGRFGQVLTLTSDTLETIAFGGALEMLDSPRDSSLVTSWLNDQESAYRVILYITDAIPTTWTQQCFQQADHLLLVADATHAPDAPYPNQALVENRDLAITRDLMLVHPDHQEPLGTLRWLKAHSVQRHFHAARNRPDSIARLARFLMGQAVGIIFAGGGARGFSHIGVMRALNEAGVPVDIVGGVSAGALMGAFLAQERHPDEAEQLGTQYLTNFVDYTLPLVSLSSGKRLSKGVDVVCGDKHIEDLWLKFFCVSTNLSTSSLHVHTQGRLHQAVRASASIPGVFPPVIADNETRDILVDGGVMNNVPTDVMQQTFAPGTMIVIELGGETSARRSPFNHDEVLSGFSLLLNRLNPLRQKRIKAPSLAGTLFRTLMMNDSASLEKQRSIADIYMTPDLKKYSIFRADSVTELSQVGYEYARTAIAEWKEKHPSIIW